MASSEVELSLDVSELLRWTCAPNCLATFSISSWSVETHTLWKTPASRAARRTQPMSGTPARRLMFFSGMPLLPPRASTSAARCGGFSRPRPAPRLRCSFGGRPRDGRPRGAGPDVAAPFSSASWGVLSSKINTVAWAAQRETKLNRKAGLEHYLKRPQWWFTGLRLGRKQVWSPS